MTSTKTPSLSTFATLFLNHLDAWGITAVIVTAALFIHLQFNQQGLILLLLLTTTYWLGFAINDYFDAAYDAQDSHKAKRNFFVLQPIAKQTAVFWFCVLFILLLIGYATFGWRGIGLLLLCFPIAWAYSAPPIRLKSVPGLDLITHALFVESFPYVTVLFLLKLPFMLLDGLTISVLILASLSAQLEQQTRDYEVDARFERNFTTTFGLSTARFLIRLCSLLIMAVFIGSMITNVAPLALFPFGILALPLFGYRLFRQHQPRPPRLVKYSTLAAIGYAGILAMLTLT